MKLASASSKSLFDRVRASLFGAGCAARSIRSRRPECRLGTPASVYADRREVVNVAATVSTQRLQEAVESGPGCVDGSGEVTGGVAENRARSPGRNPIQLQAGTRAISSGPRCASQRPRGQTAVDAGQDLSSIRRKPARVSGGMAHARSTSCTDLHLVCTCNRYVAAGHRQSGSTEEARVNLAGCLP